jgi:hypothetical protein
LRLVQEPLYEVIIDDRSEVLRGVVRIRSQHLRDITWDLGQARTRPEALEGSP